MKLLFALISLIGLIAWANADETYDKTDPAMAIGMDKAPQGDFNDPTKAHQMALKSYGLNTSAYCPECAKQNAIHEAADDGTMTTSSGSSNNGSSSSGETQQ